MKEKSLLQYHATGIAGLLRTEQLAVPFYQRSYSWHVDEYAKSDSSSAGEKSQVDDFWSDLIQGFFDKRSYFLGTIVLANDDDQGGRKVVIDGQQRLATASILIACIRDELKKRGEDEFAGSTQTDYIGKFDRQVGSSQPKLILNSDDRDYYNRAILNGNWSETKAANLSQNLLSDAYTFLSMRVSEFVRESGSSWRDRLVALLTYLDESVQVVAIDVGTQADAFLIFETLNDRGADLTVADLLKNYLFSQAGGRLDEVRDAWVATLSNLNIEKVGNQRFTTFARHLMSSKYGRTRERELYGKIRSSYSGPASVVTFSQELKDSSKLYDALLTADSDYWGDFDERTLSTVEVLGILNLEQYRPLLIAAMTSFEKEEIKRFLASMVNWSVRGLAGGTLGAGSAEAAFCEAAREIRAGKIKTTEDVLQFSRVGALIPSDPAFKTAFAEWRVPRAALARYLLRALELAHQNEKEPELVVNSDESQVNLEHILPRSSKEADWPNFSADDRRALTYRLGNMCLLKKGPNGRIGNKAWSVKQPVIAASKLALTTRLGVHNQWGEREIQANQKFLADLAIKAWPRLPRG